MSNFFPPTITSLALKEPLTFGWCWCQAQCRFLRGSSVEMGAQCGKLKVSKKQISPENISPWSNAQGIVISSPSRAWNWAGCTWWTSYTWLRCWDPGSLISCILLSLMGPLISKIGLFLISPLEAPGLLLAECDTTGTTRATGFFVSSVASYPFQLSVPWDANMQRFTNPLLRHVISRGCFDAASKKQCLQYLRALRALQLNGFNTVFLGETDISESLITGEKIDEEASLRWPVWTLVHAGSSQGWVPWRYKVLLRDELPVHQQNGVFQELCDSLTTSYGKCVIVTRDKRQLTHVEAKDGKEQETEALPPVPPVIYMSGIKCCPEIARANGHELLVAPSSYSYLSPMDVAWSSLKWFIINNRKDFALKSVETTHSYRCILFSDMIIKGIEKMTPNKWKVAINRVKKWENYYLDTFS